MSRTPDSGLWADADVCGWPDDDKPVEDPENHRAYCAGLKAAAKAGSGPIPRDDTGWDALSAEARAHAANWRNKGGTAPPGAAKAEAPPEGSFDPRALAPVPEGRYEISILPRDIVGFAEHGMTGFRFWIGVVAGPHAGRDIQIRFFTGTTDPRKQSLVHFDLTVLAGWMNAVGVGEVSDPGELVRRVASYGNRVRVFAVLRHKRWGRGVEVYVTAIEAEARP